MENLIIDSTKSTPQIYFDAEKNYLLMVGQTYPEDAAKFYQPIFQWLKEYFANVNSPITFKVKLVYINTSSSKCLMTLFDILEEAFIKGKKINIYWHYDADNEITQGSGEDFKEGLEVPFELVEDKAF